MNVRNPHDKLIRLITFLGGIYFVLEFILPQAVLDSTGISKHHEAITNGFLAAVYVSIGLGIINLCLVHGSKLVFRRSGALYSGILLAGLLLMILVSGVDWYYALSDAAKLRRIEVLSLYTEAVTSDAAAKRSDVLPVKDRVNLLIPHLEDISSELVSSSSTSKAEDASKINIALNEKISLLKQSPESLETVSAITPLILSARTELSARLTTIREERLSHRLFTLLFDGIFTPLGSSMFALLAFYIAAAAYRAFRVKSVESSLMMGAALIVILGQTSVGLMISESFASIRLWLLEVPSAGVFRAIKLGAGIATLVLCIRMWFSIEAENVTGGSSDA